MTKGRTGRGGKWRNQQDVIRAAVIWGCCPSSGGYPDACAIEDTCEILNEKLAVLNGGERLPDDLTIEQAIKLADRLARLATRRKRK